MNLGEEKFLYLGIQNSVFFYVAMILRSTVMDLIRILTLLAYFIMVNWLSSKCFVLSRSFSVTSEILTQLTLVSWIWTWKRHWGVTAESHTQVPLWSSDRDVENAGVRLSEHWNPAGSNREGKLDTEMQFEVRSLVWCTSFQSCQHQGTRLFRAFFLWTPIANHSKRERKKYTKQKNLTEKQSHFCTNLGEYNWENVSFQWGKTFPPCPKYLRSYSLLTRFCLFEQTSKID